MQIGGIAWWLLLGMFGFGAAVGLGVSYLATQKLTKPVPGDFWGGCVGVFFAMGIMAVAMPLAGIVAVGLTFVAHHVGWDAPMPFLAGIGLVFLTLVAGWVLWLRFKK